jgi:dsDNA-specific endonuclease/ATPase MutS2
MASKTPGILNGAMAFDEKNLMPLYKLNIGKPEVHTRLPLQKGSVWTDP